MDDFRINIHSWYAENKRDLPWRETVDPYRIWLSEIILQQTRVSQGLEYYLKFIERYPTIQDLANASEDEVLKLWQGLGYYSRARNLHHTAKYILQHYKGIFPRDYNTIIKLKGIGDYTAAAIASIAYDLRYAVLDGNVFRLFARYFGIKEPIDTNAGKKKFKELATKLLDADNPGMHNQAMMEFGALQCVPVNPDCNVCPLHEKCYALAYNMIGQLPAKKGRVKIRERYFNYLVVFSGSSVFLQKRLADDIWKNMYQFPLIESEKKDYEVFPNGALAILKNFGEVQLEKVTDWNKHQLSHQKIFYRFFILQALSEKKVVSGLIKVDKKDIFNFAVPKLLENFINSNINV